MSAKFIYILFFTFIGTSLSAADVTWVNAFPIYVYGDAGYIGAAYEFVSSIVGDSAVALIIQLGFVIATLIAGYQARLGGAIDIGKSVLAPITLYILFFAPAAKVNIVDLRVDYGLINYATPSGGYKEVNNVPYVIAAIPGTISLLVTVMVDTIDSNWGSVQVGNVYSSLGFQGMPTIVRDAVVLANLPSVESPSIDDSNSTLQGISHNVNQYVKHCLLGKAIEASKANSALIRNPSLAFPDMWNPSNLKGNVGLEEVTFDDGVDFNGTRVVDVSCANLYTTYISAHTGALSDAMRNLLKSKYPEVEIDSPAFVSAFKENLGEAASVNLVGDIKKAMVVSAMTKTLQKSYDSAGIGVNAVSYATELSIQTTIANLRTEGLAKFEWITRVLPDAITLIQGIMIGAFPLMVIVMSFVGKNGVMAFTNFFMGYIAIVFNTVSLALVNNIISYYTAQKAQDTLVQYAGMPFGLENIGDFLYYSADMAGFAGLIGAASVFAVTPLVFKGETAGLNAAMGGLTGAFRGNVSDTATKSITDYDAQQELDRRNLTTDGLTEEQAAQWLNGEGFSRPSNMSAVQAYNDIMKNYASIGSAEAANIMHSGNMDKFNSSNYISGNAAQSIQKGAKTAGFGASVNEGAVDMADISSVSVQDGEVMGSNIAKTNELRNGDGRSFDTSAVGAGQAISQYAKDIASAKTAELDNDARASVANATSAVAGQIAAGMGLLQTGAFNPDGSFHQNSSKGSDFMSGTSAQSREKFDSTAGYGSAVDADKTAAKAFEDGARSAETANKASDLMFSGKKDANDRPIYERGDAAKGAALSELAALQGQMQTAIAADKGKTGEQNGDVDYIMGAGAQARKAANDNIGIGETFGAMSNKEQIEAMAKVKENATTGFFGGIEATNADIAKRGGSEGAIEDMITDAQEKAIAGSTHADNMRAAYGKNLNGSFKGMTLADTLGEIDQSKIDQQAGQALGIKANKGMGVDYTDNTMYGEMSNQQSTKAKLDAQGGVGGAVMIDTTDAQIKAKTQEKVLDAQIKQGGAKDGLDSSAQDLSKAADKLSQVAGTMAGGKSASDIASVEQYDTPEKFISAQRRDSIAKTTGSRIMDEMSTNEQAKNNIVGEEKNQIFATKGKAGLEKYIKEGQEMGFLDDNGNANSNADEWVRGRATFSASGMNKHEQGVISGARVSTAFNAITGEAISNVDGVRKVEDGTATNAHVGDPGNIPSQQTKETYEHLMNPLSKGLPTLVGKSHDAAVAFFKEQGMEDEGAQTMASLATMGGAAVTAAGITEVGYKIKNSVMGNYVASKDFTYGTGKFDGDGNEIMKDVKAGEHVSTKNNLALQDYIKNNKGVAKVEKGIPGKVLSSMINKGVDSRNSFSGNEAPDETSSSKNQSSDSSQDNKTDNKVQQGTPPNSNSKDIISENVPSSKSPSISEQIDAEAKKQKLLNSDEKFVAEKEALQTKHKEQNRLNGTTGPSSVERMSRQSADMLKLENDHLSRIKMEAEAMKGATGQIEADKKESRFSLGNVKSAATGLAKGMGVSFLGDELVQETLDSGNVRRANVYQAAVNVADGLGNAVLGGVSTVLGGADALINSATGSKPIGSAMAWSGITKSNDLVQTGINMVDKGAGNVGNAFVNIRDAVNDSDSVYGKTKGGNTALGNIFGYGSISQSVGSSAVPPHAHTAFNTPSGFNTMSAMTGGAKNAYNDNTNNKNSTPMEYRTDHTEATMDFAADSAIGTEYMQESVSAMEEQIEKLNETIYKKGE